MIEKRKQSPALVTFTATKLVFHGFHVSKQTAMLPIFVHQVRFVLRERYFDEPIK